MTIPVPILNLRVSQEQKVRKKERIVYIDTTPWSITGVSQSSSIYGAWCREGWECIFIVFIYPSSPTLNIPPHPHLQSQLHKQAHTRSPPTFPPMVTDRRSDIFLFPLRRTKPNHLIAIVTYFSPLCQGQGYFFLNLFL